MLIRSLALCLPFVLIACAPMAPRSGTATSVTVPSADAKVKGIPGTLYEPIGAGPFPVVILLNGCGGLHWDADIFSGITGQYLPNGIATLAIDYFGARGIGEPCKTVKEADESVAYGVRDVHAAVAWLAGRPEIDSKRIFLQGYSNGARIAIAAIDARRPMVDNAMANELAVDPPHVAGVIAYFPYCFADTKFPVPTRIFVGEKDDWTPAPRCQAIVDKTNVELTVYPKATHDFVHPGPERTYQGHHMSWDRPATDDAQQHALQFIQSQGK
jgi:dienelactone hydrolase